MLEPALERQAVERDVCNRQLLLLKRQLAERHALNDGALSLALRSADARIESLTFQLDRARDMASRLEKRVGQMTHEAHRTNHGLLASIDSAAASASSGDKDAAGVVGAALDRVAQLGEVEDREVESEERVRTFLETRVLRGVLAADSLPSQVTTMLHELTAQKLAQERLAEKLMTSERRSASSRTQLAALRETLRAAEREILSLRAAAAAAATVAAVGEGSAALEEGQSAAAAVHAAAAAKQRIEALEAEASQAASEAKALREGMAGWEARVNEGCERRIRAAQEQLSTEHKQAMAIVQDRLLQERAAHGRAMRLAQRQASADLQTAREAWAKERGTFIPAAASGSSVAGSASGPRDAQAVQIHQSAQHIASENHKLHTAVASAQQQLDAAAGEIQLRDAAIQRLEAALTAVTTAGTSAADTAPVPPPPQPMPRPTCLPLSV